MNAVLPAEDQKNLRALWFTSDYQFSLENQFLSKSANLFIYWGSFNKEKYVFSNIP